MAGAGFLTIAPEFYHRDAAPGRWLERDDAGRQEGFGYLHRLRRDQALADVAAGIEWLRSERGIERVAVPGAGLAGPDVSSAARPHTARGVRRPLPAGLINQAGAVAVGFTATSVTW